MYDSDVLLTIAEVAVAFAGFASLVSILGQQDSLDPPLVLGLRMRAMLLTSLLVVGFSLVPIVLHEYGLGAHAVWVFASLGLLAASLGYASWLLGAFRAIGRARIRPGALQRRLIIPTLLLFSGRRHAATHSRPTARERRRVPDGPGTAPLPVGLRVLPDRVFLLAETRSERGRVAPRCGPAPGSGVPDPG